MRSEIPACSGLLRRVLFIGLAALATLMAAPAPFAGAHGEQTQEAFLRQSTVLIYDVKFESNGKVGTDDDMKINVGDEVTVTGNVRLMDSWPEHTIKPAHIGFLSVVAPGPVFAVKDRQMNGQFTPQSVEISKGQTFPFKVVIVAKNEGRWHVHPSFAIEGTGTLVGRGQWFDVGPGTYTNQLELASGETIDANTYGNWQVWIWHASGVVLAVLWLWFWLRRPVIERLYQVDAGNTKVITDRDKFVGIALAVAAIASLIIGNVYAMTKPSSEPMPLQVDRVEPRPQSDSVALVDAKIKRAEFRNDEHAVVLDLEVANTSAAPVSLNEIQLAEETFVTKDHSPLAGSMKGLTVEGGAVAAGETKTLTVKLDSDMMLEKNLLPLKEPQVRITGLMFFSDNQGHRQITEVDEVTSPILPRN